MKVRNKEEVVDEARTKGRKDHFASLMDHCQLKNSELKSQLQKYKGRVVLKKDYSCSYEVFTEQWSSTSQTTAATAMGVYQGYLVLQDKPQYPLVRRSK